MKITNIYLACLFSLFMTLVPDSGHATTTLAKCCHGTSCTAAVSADGTCQSCTTNADCGGIIIPTTCPDDCPNTTWTTTNGRQVRCNTNSYTCQYRCARGYYKSSGSNNNSTLVCTQCPTVGLTGMLGSCAVGTTPPYSDDNDTYSASDKSECYIKPGVSCTDISGTFTYDIQDEDWSYDNCYYDE